MCVMRCNVLICRNQWCVIIAAAGADNHRVLARVSSVLKDVKGKRGCFRKIGKFRSVPPDVFTLKKEIQSTSVPFCFSASEFSWRHYM